MFFWRYQRRPVRFSKVNHCPQRRRTLQRLNMHRFMTCPIAEIANVVEYSERSVCAIKSNLSVYGLQELLQMDSDSLEALLHLRCWILYVNTCSKRLDYIGTRWYCFGWTNLMYKVSTFGIPRDERYWHISSSDEKLKVLANCAKTKSLEVVASL